MNDADYDGIKHWEEAVMNYLNLEQYRGKSFRLIFR